MLTEHQLQTVIPQLDTLRGRAETIREDLVYLTDIIGAASELALVVDKTQRLIASLEAVNDALKKSRALWVREQVTAWHYRRIDDERPTSAPIFESVAYQGHDEWTLTIFTPTHGREHIELRGCDGVNWSGVYSVKPI